MFTLNVLLLSLLSTATLTLESGDAQVNLIELYSSEGCSSCPPADKWLAQLRKNKGLWKHFVPLEFHVDYWNHLGWVDPFSDKSFSIRQGLYSRQWGNNGVYTPGFVVNGKEWRPGKGQNLLSSIGSPGNLKVRQLSGGQFSVQFTAKKKGLGKELRVFAALLANGLETKVPKGENAGVSLKHEFVVLRLVSTKLVLAKGSYTGKISLPLTSKIKAKSRSLAFWVSSLNNLTPIQAVGGDIGLKSEENTK